MPQIEGLMRNVVGSVCTWACRSVLIIVYLIDKLKTLAVSDTHTMFYDAE